MKDATMKRRQIIFSRKSWNKFPKISNIFNYSWIDRKNRTNFGAILTKKGCTQIDVGNMEVSVNSSSKKYRGK